MKFSLISRLVLTLLGFCGIGQLALAQDKVTKTANISLEGTLPPNCSVKINNGKEFFLKMASPDTKSEAISLVSSCNRSSKHTLELAFDYMQEEKPALRHRDNKDATPVTYKIMRNNGAEEWTSPLESAGREMKESIQVHFETDHRAAGTYEGNVTITLKDA